MTLGRMENFSRVALKRYMKAAGMNQAKLAAYCGTSKAVVSYWVSGAHLPAVPFAPKIAAALGVTVMDLARKTDPNDIDIVDLRYIRGIAAADVARQTVLTPDKIGLLEEAVSMPKVAYFDILAEFYDLTPDELRRSWVARRVNLYGVESLAFLDTATQEALAPWPEFYLHRNDGQAGD